ncbi:hypothetical protein L228DRAFT_215835 [Xylona heveae TC161]|uniref:Uncharacterized protein n=1 Tax=Xylona heveae (strain CBS 132557 / TC161) TaxID=1328760 RepID=A0A164Z7S9_XYLHT|nr:hypothetical protein L228DRAFT_215835 [Xylona heveae TC161]KZF18793.1 hypothetical protein L228DRAFT_215835 [Xylona heveae TC161]
MSSDRDTDSDSDYTDSDKTSLRTSRGRCQCSCRQNVPIDVRCRIHAVKLRGQSSALKLLAHVFGRGLKIEDICHIHLRRLAGGLGLKTNFSGSLLRDRLARVYENRKDIRVLTTGNNTFSWFRRDSRPVREEDLLSAYRFSSIPVKTFSFDARAVFGRFLGRDADGIQEAWHSNGSITVPGIFRWWWESQSGLIAKIVQDEFDMYDHHLQASNGKPNYGWLRNMFHSLAQQLMRQDPVYYALYCALRPDQAWRLISYPYYTKYARQNDSTYFRHIDINIPRWIETGVGGNLIQGSMSLDDEDELNTTELLMGMHHHLHTWWALVEERGLSVRAPVIRITDAMYTAEDQDRFGCRWTAQPCKAGDVRITSPLLPHGSTGPATRRRRTMLPWFVAIGDDHLTLDVQESGTWEDLAAAHRNLECAPRTPSGKPVLYAKAPYRFPAATELMNLGALSDALVGRRQWTSPAVMAERDLVLGRDDKAALAYVENWRKNALLSFSQAWSLVVAAEKARFGTQSYFYCRDHDVEPVSG